MKTYSLDELRFLLLPLVARSCDEDPVCADLSVSTYNRIIEATLEHLAGQGFEIREVPIVDLEDLEEEK